MTHIHYIFFATAIVSLAPNLAALGQVNDSIVESAPSRYAMLKGNRIHYKSLGDGKPAVVLVHGWSCDLTFWKEQVPALAGRVRVVLLDLPGHGKSDKPKIEYTMDVFAKSVDAVL